MKKKSKLEPCVICEDYIVGIECDRNECPVYILKQQYEQVKKELDRMKYEKSWDDEIRTSDWRREMW